MNRPPSIKEIVEFGLDAIPSDRMVEVPLRDLMFIHQTLAEWNRFFHQPLHHNNIEAVDSFLGSLGSGGGYEVLHEALYHRFGSMLPSDTWQQIEDSVFEHPGYPAYYGDGT